MAVTKVDRLTLSAKAAPAALPELIATITSKPVTFEATKPAHGFLNAQAAIVGGVRMAWFAWGGTSQRNRVYVDLTGQGCGMVDDWDTALELLAGMPGSRLTRLDICADFLRGQVTYEQVKAAYTAGKFNRFGRPPGIETIEHGDDRDKGRTAYIGDRSGEQHACCYEKGLQEFAMLLAAQGAPGVLQRAGVTEHLRFKIGDEEVFAREWFRCEGRLRRSREREISWDAIPDRDSYFAGMYPFFAELLPDADQAFFLRSPRRSEVEVQRVLMLIRQQYGSSLFTALVHYHGDVRRVWRQIVGDRHNARMVEAGALLNLVEGKPCETVH